ncbi:MAG: peptidylprolyl isomerase [Crocinitomicaceae bacterium]
MKHFFFVYFFLFLHFSAQGQELTSQQMAQLKATYNEARMQVFLTEHPTLKTEVVFLNSFDKRNTQDSLCFLLGFSGLREVDNGDGTLSYYKLVESTSEVEYHVRTIFLDSKKLETEKIQALQEKIMAQLQSGETFEKLYALHNMDNRANYGDLGWVPADALQEPFTSLVKIHLPKEYYRVDIPYLNSYFIAQNLEEPKNQTRKKFLKVTIVK